MSRQVDQTRRLRAVPTPAAIGLALAAAPLTWWGVGPLGTGWPDHDLGPYHVSVGIEVAIGVVALAVAAASGVAIAASVRRPAPRAVGITTTALLVLAGVVGAAGWRVATAGGTGANIGGGMVQLFGPTVIAGLLAAAAVTEARRRRARPLHAAAWLVLAVLVAPLLYGAELAVHRYEQSVGVIGSDEYASVHVGQTHHDVRDRLGRPGEVVDWFFAPPPAGSVCDYYDAAGTDSGVYRICYRDGVVVNKQSSDHPR